MKQETNQKRAAPNVENGPRPGGPAPQGAAVAVVRSYADRGSGLRAIQSAQFRQKRQQGRRQIQAHAGNRAEQVILLTPRSRFTVVPLWRQMRGWVKAGYSARYKGVAW